MQIDKSIFRYAWLSIGAALLTIVLKFGAWYATGSVGLLSDAMESLVNLAAAGGAFYALYVASQPPDRSHAYGHGKAEYFAAAAEGVLILAAAGAIVAAAVSRFADPAPLTRLGPGLAVALVAAGVNWITARIMLRAALRFDSITLESDARHLMTDVWTSGGVVAGLFVVMVAPPAFQILDPIIAIAMAANIVRTGLSLVKRSVQGLMDRALPPREIELVVEAVSRHAGETPPYHDLRTRKSGSQRFVEFHLLVPGSMTVQASHDLCCDIERDIKKWLDNTLVTIHVEPKEDGKSWDGHATGRIDSRHCDDESEK